MAGDGRTLSSSPEACGRYAAPGALPEAMIRRAPGAGGEDAGDGPSPLPMPAGALLRSAADGGRGAGPYGAHRRPIVRSAGSSDAPIGKFQAVQQQMAELAGYAACMQAASQQAFAAVQKHGMPESGGEPRVAGDRHRQVPLLGTRASGHGGSRMGCMGRSGSPRRWGCSTSAFRCGAGARNMGAIPDWAAGDRNARHRFGSEPDLGGPYGLDPIASSSSVRPSFPETLRAPGHRRSLARKRCPAFTLPKRKGGQKALAGAVDGLALWLLARTIRGHEVVPLCRD